jgi:hypothetical protein
MGMRCNLIYDINVKSIIMGISMKKWSFVPVALAGFIGGVAFIVSCGGGSSSSGIGPNTAIGDVPPEQLICDRLTTGNYGLSDPFNCFDTDGNSQSSVTLSSIFAQGWRIQLVLGSDTVFYR